MNNIIPGGVNLLALANRAIGFSSCVHKRWRGNAEDDAGIVDPQYYPDEPIKASIQPVPRTMIELLGLDVQKDYVTIYTTADVTVRDTERNVSGDLVLFDGNTYQAESNTKWVAQNGWRGTVFVSLGKTC